MRIGKTAMALAGSASLVALLAGCGSSGSNNSSSGPVNITYATFVVTRYPLLQKYVNKFNQAHKGKIHVTLEHEPGSNAMLTKLLSELQAGTAPQLVEQYGVYTPQLQSKGAIVPINSFIKKSHYSLQGFYPDEIQGATIDGKLWGLSIDGGPENLAIYYNKKLFEKYHVPFPTANWTWAQMLADAQKLNHPTQKEYGFLTFLGQTEGVSTRFYTWLWNAGGQLMNTSNTKAAFNSPAGLKALTMVSDLAKYSDVVARSEYEAAFQSGHVAMSEAGGWNIGTFTQSKLDYAVAPLPAMTPNGTRWTSAGPDYNLITKSTPAQEQAAWTFLQYLESPQLAAAMSADGNAPWRQISASQYPQYAATLKQYPQVGQEVAAQAHWQKLPPSFPNYSQMSLQVATMVESVLLNKTTPKQALAHYAQLATEAASGGSNP